jgi:hypothetical protein
MDGTALQALIAEVHGTAAALAQTEHRVASATAELAQQGLGAQPAQQTRARDLASGSRARSNRMEAC